MDVEHPDDEVDEEEILEKVRPLLPNYKVAYCELDQIETMGEMLYG